MSRISKLIFNIQFWFINLFSGAGTAYRKQKRKEPTPSYYKSAMVMIGEERTKQSERPDSSNKERELVNNEMAQIAAIMAYDFNFPPSIDVTDIETRLQILSVSGAYIVAEMERLMALNSMQPFERFIFISQIRNSILSTSLKTHLNSAIENIRTTRRWPVDSKVREYPFTPSEAVETTEVPLNKSKEEKEEDKLNSL